MNKPKDMPRFRTNFLTNIRREEEIDEYTFDVWKSELQKELPSFWESIRKT